MAVVDLGDAAFEARAGVETVHALAAPGKMGISDVNVRQHCLIARRPTH